MTDISHHFNAAMRIWNIQKSINIDKYTLRKANLTVVNGMALVKNELRNYREKAGLTQEKLAERVAVSRQTIISIENGRYTPSLELALKFAFLFHCRVEDLFGIT
jgi:putative transcriptional regulator